MEQRISWKAGLTDGEIRTAARRRTVVQARRAFSQLAVRQLGYTGAEVARYLGVTTSCVTRAAASAQMEALAGGLGELELS